MFLIILLFCSLITYSKQEDSENFQSLWTFWKQKYTKSYDSVSEQLRQSIFKRNVNKISMHNLQYDLGLETFRMGLNKFSDLSPEEFRKLFTHRLSNPPTLHSENIISLHASEHVKEPVNFDWRKKGYVTPVHDQGSCHADWAFSAIGALEAQYKRNFDSLIDLSAQQLLDCSNEFGNLGCTNGQTMNSFRYSGFFGIEADQDYPYTGEVNPCAFDSSLAKAQPKFIGKIEEGDESALKNVVYNYGPVSVTFDALDALQYYKNGIYESKECSTSKPVYSMLVVGYGKMNETEYWLLKNSIGTDWGEKGYMRLARNKQNMCGIASVANLPLFETSFGRI